MKYLKLIRIHHLFFIAAVMFSMRYFLMEPVLSRYGLTLVSSEFEFGLLVFAVLLITGAASIINQYFDRKSDLHNRPSEVVIGTKIDRRFAIILHSVLNLLGVVAGFYLCTLAGHFWYGTIFIFITIVFYLYSGRYKRRLISGNLLISLLISGITFLPWIMEYLFAKPTINGQMAERVYHHLMILSLGFSIAGFLLNMARETVKDMIDFRGDYQAGSKTIPIVFGKKVARRTSSLLFVFTTAYIVFSWFIYLKNIAIIEDKLLTVSYLGIFLVAPLIFLSLYILQANKRRHLFVAMRILQVIMLLGVLFSLVIFLNIQ